MAWTKRQYIEQAYEVLGLASYVYDLQPEQWRGGLQKLDLMMTEWNTRGIRVGYPVPSNPNDSELSEVCNCPDAANPAIVSNLAIRIAPSVGKAVPLELLSIANSTFKTVLGYCATPGEIAFGRNIPSGAGNGTGSVYLPQDEALAAGADSTLGV